MAAAQQTACRFFVERRDTPMARRLAKLRRRATSTTAGEPTDYDGVAGVGSVGVVLALAAFGVELGFGATWLFALLLSAAGLTFALAVAMDRLSAPVFDRRLQRMLELTAAHRDRAERLGETVLTGELAAHHRRLAGLADPLNEAWRRRERLSRRLRKTLGMSLVTILHDTVFTELVERHDDDLVIAGVYDELHAEAQTVDATEHALRQTEAATTRLVGAAKDALRAREKYAGAARVTGQEPHTAEVSDAEQALARVREHRDAVVAAIAELPR